MPRPWGPRQIGILRRPHVAPAYAIPSPRKPELTTHEVTACGAPPRVPGASPLLWPRQSVVDSTPGRWQRRGGKRMRRRALAATTPDIVAQSGTGLKPACQKAEWP